MATIDLNNLIRPKKVNNPTTIPSKQITPQTSVYTDLHLDFQFAKSIGLGENASLANDIIVDYDYDAIKNSIRNLLTTKKGQKVLNPDYGVSLENYLFEPVNEFNAKSIGHDIDVAISNYEPRISVIKIYVNPQLYNTTNLNYIGNQVQKFTKNIIQADPNLVPEYGPGYSISVIYEILEIKTQQTLNMFAQLGGQILF